MKRYKQEFRDIHKFPKDWGIVLFPISMSRIANAQSPKKCIEAIEFLTKKIQVNRAGANFIYTEGVYMNFEKDAYETKNNFAQTSANHMQGVKKLIAKNYLKFQIDNAFSFESWFQMYLAHKDFFGALRVVQDLYKKNKDFQKYVAQDATDQNKKLDKRQIAFYLEEHTMSYLMMNREVVLRNDFVNGREQWVLFTYPGKPPRGQIYLVQKDPLQLNGDSNPYKGQYDLVEKKFVPYLEVDLEKYD